MPLIVGNWKMNGLKADGTLLAAGVAAKAKGNLGKGREVVVCPPFTIIERVQSKLIGSGVGLGAQDCAPKESGAFTGDISPGMIKEAGASWVILGHSERRAGHGESDALVRAKVEAAEAAGLTTIVCIGETLEEHDGGRAKDVVARQLQGSLPDKRPARWVVAYEPVWAIGSGRTAKAEVIGAMHRHIIVQLQRRFGKLDGVSILYGGSVKADNAREILNIDGVDGALVGGASLKVDEFWAICSART